MNTHQPNRPKMILLNVCLILHITSSLRAKTEHTVKTLISGTNQSLLCEFDLEGDQLYSILWWRGESTITKFVLQNDQEKNLGIQTSLESSHLNWNQPMIKIRALLNGEIIGVELLLRNVSKNDVSIYNCEVTAEAPFFHTINITYGVMVVDPPKRRPLLHSSRGSVLEGTSITASCYSAPSLPEANITFFINNKEVEDTYMSVIDKVKTEVHRFVYIRAVNFRAFRQLFYEGNLILECQVSQDELFWRSSAVLWLDDFSNCTCMDSNMINIIFWLIIGQWYFLK